MNSVILTCLSILGVIVVAYVVYMVIGMFLFKRTAKRHGVRRTIIKIGPKNKPERKSKKRR